MARLAPLVLELLEDRLAPASFNVPWPEARDLTLSFAPDGTAAGTQASALFRTLDAQLPTPVWQEEVLRAFQTWAVASDVNVGVEPDGGQPFGTLGLKQGDPRFGDVRIGAYPMDGNLLALADPYDPFVANSWVGDVFLNSAEAFGLGAAGAEYDLYSVLLHEAGHVFGLDHSADTGSPMFEHFENIRTGLTPADVARLQALYGPRPPDAFEGPGGNGSPAAATPLDLGGATASLRADVTALTDADVYRFVVPAGSSTVTVSLQAAGLSLLVPRLTVTDANGTVVGSALAVSPLANDLSLCLDGVRAGQTYFVRVEGGRTDVFGIGSYTLTVDPWAGATDPDPVPASPRVPAPSLPGDLQLLATTPGYVEHTYYEVAERAADPNPVHTYRVRSADLGPGMTNVMTVVAYSLGSYDSLFHVQVFDDQGRPVAAQVINDAPGELAVQVPSVLSDRDYFVQLRADATGMPGPSDRYEVEIDFDHDASHLESFVNDTLAAGQAQAERALQVVQGQVFHFVLSASDWSAPQETGVRMTIEDAAGHTIYTLSVADGATRGGEVFLNAGLYTVRFTRAAGDGGTLTPLLFQLRGAGLSEPLGPQLQDTTFEPLDSNDAVTSIAQSFYWLPFGSRGVASQSATANGLGGEASVTDRTVARFLTLSGSAGQQPTTPAVTGAGDVASPPRALASPVAPANFTPTAITSGTSEEEMVAVDPIEDGGRARLDEPAAPSRPALSATVGRGSRVNGLVTRLVEQESVRQAPDLPPPESTQVPASPAVYVGAEASPAGSDHPAPDARTRARYVLTLVAGVGGFALGWLVRPTRPPAVLVQVMNRLSEISSRRRLRR